MYWIKIRWISPEHSTAVTLVSVHILMGVIIRTRVILLCIENTLASNCFDSTGLFSVSSCSLQTPPLDCIVPKQRIMGIIKIRALQYIYI